MKDTPGIAPLIKRTLENVGKFIQHVQNEDSLCLYVVDYYRFSFGEQIGEDKSVKEKNEVELLDYINFQKSTSHDSCSYLFRKGHPWCLLTFEDFPHFILGCDSEIAGQLNQIDGLEYFETSRDYKLQHGVFSNL
jgi:hypothetical protein